MLALAVFWKQLIIYQFSWSLPSCDHQASDWSSPAPT